MVIRHILIKFFQVEGHSVCAVSARKFFVTGVKDLSTGVNYMDSKVDFWSYSDRCQGSEYRCQVYEFQSGFLVYSYQCQGSEYQCQVYGFQSGFWFYSYRCQGSEYWCQVYGFQSGFSVLLMKVMLPGIEVASILGAELDSLR